MLLIDNLFDESPLLSESSDETQPASIDPRTRPVT